MLILPVSIRASSISVTYPDIDGAILIGGDGVAYFRRVNATPSGGLELGGDGVHLSALAFGSDGAIVLGGDGLPVRVSLQSGQGQDGAVVIGGDGGARGISIASGGIDGAIKIGGDAVDYYRERYALISGGIVLGGDGIGTILRGVYIDPDGALCIGGDSVGAQWSLASGEGRQTGEGALVIGGDGAYLFELNSDGALVLGGDGIGLIDIELNGDSYTIGTERHRGPTTQIDIMLAMRQRLVDSGVFSLTNVYIARDPTSARETLPSNDKFCAILASDKDIDQGQLMGGGTDADFRTEVFEIRVYTRMQLDRIGQADIWTTHGTKGCYAVARSVASKFQIHDLFNIAGTCIVGQPTRIMRIGAPVDRKDGLGYVPVYVEVKYTERAP